MINLVNVKGTFSVGENIIASFPNTQITKKISGINSPIQYPKRGSKEETPEERRKRRVENKTM